MSFSHSHSQQSTGGAVGGMVYPIVYNTFLHGSVGFAWAVRISAFISLAILACANLLMTPRYEITRAPSVSEVSSEESVESQAGFVAIVKDWPFTLANVACAPFIHVPPQFRY
jgi:hypothetical protein